MERTICQINLILVITAAIQKLAVIQLKHDIRFEHIKLSRENPKIEFILNSEDSYLMIANVYVISSFNTDNYWSNFIAKVKLTAELKNIVYVDPEG